MSGPFLPRNDRSARGLHGACLPEVDESGSREQTMIGLDRNLSFSRFRLVKVQKCNYTCMHVCMYVLVHVKCTYHVRILCRNFELRATYATRRYLNFKI